MSREVLRGGIRTSPVIQLQKAQFPSDFSLAFHCLKSKSSTTENDRATPTVIALWWFYSAGQLNFTTTSFSLLLFKRERGGRRKYAEKKKKKKKSSWVKDNLIKGGEILKNKQNQQKPKPNQTNKRQRLRRSTEGRKKLLSTSHQQVVFGQIPGSRASTHSSCLGPQLSSKREPPPSSSFPTFYCRV